MSNVIFSPKSMTYALVAHNHTKVGYAVQEVISEARKHGIKAPRHYEVEGLINMSGASPILQLSGSVRGSRPFNPIGK